jgi:hypothetical protein
VGPGHYLGTIAAFKPVPTGAYQEPRHPPPHGKNNLWREQMTQPIAANGPILTVRNLVVVVTFIAVALVLWLVAARTGQSAPAATQIHHFSHPWR